jgi:hypothetical protein
VSWTEPSGSTPLKSSASRRTLAGGGEPDIDVADLALADVEDGASRNRVG